jgi:transmembrane sensor
MARDGVHDDERTPDPGADPELQDALDWFVRLQDAGATAADRRAFRAWYDADARHRDAYARVQAVWGAPELDRAARGLKTADGAAAPRPGRRVRRRGMALAAAVLLALVGLGALFDLPVRLQADHRTATGERRQVALADGSTVLLDSASAIATQAGDAARRVELLAGRAYFQVAGDRGRAFRVEAGDAAVEVRGTRFAVALGAEGTSVVLREGRLHVTGRGGGGAGAGGVTLSPGQRVRVTAEGPGRPERVAFPQGAGWVEGRLIFRDAPLSRVLDELRRYHAGTILVLDPALAQRRITGNYRLDDPVRTAEQLAALTSAELVRLTDRILLLH